MSVVDAQAAALQAQATASGQTGAVATGNSSAAPVDPTPSASGSRWSADSGWWIAIGALIGMMSANLPVIGPAVTGILFVALIYQLNLLIGGK